MANYLGILSLANDQSFLGSSPSMVPHLFLQLISLEVVTAVEKVVAAIRTVGRTTAVAAHSQQQLLYLIKKFNFNLLRRLSQQS